MVVTVTRGCGVLVTVTRGSGVVVTVKANFHQNRHGSGTAANQQLSEIEEASIVNEVPVWGRFRAVPVPYPVE